MKKTKMLAIVATICCSNLTTAQTRKADYFETKDYYKKVDSLSWVHVSSSRNRKWYKDSLNISDPEVDSIFAIEQEENVMASANSRDTSLSPGLRFTKMFILKKMEQQKIKLVLNNNQYTKWAQMHTINMHHTLMFDTSATYKHQMDSLREARHKTDRILLRATHDSMDFFSSMTRWYVNRNNEIYEKIIADTTTLSNREKLFESLVALEKEQKQKTKEIQTKDQYNKWVDSHSVP